MNQTVLIYCDCVILLYDACSLLAIYIMSSNATSPYYTQLGCKTDPTYLLGHNYIYDSSPYNMKPYDCWSKCTMQQPVSPGAYNYFGIKKSILCWCGDLVSSPYDDIACLAYPGACDLVSAVGQCSMPCNDTSPNCGGNNAWDLYQMLAWSTNPNEKTDQITTGSHDNGLGSWVYVVIAIGSVVFLVASILFLVAVVYKIRKTKKNNRTSNPGSEVNIEIEEEPIPVEE